jgi:hypothetical protein
MTRALFRLLMAALAVGLFVVAGDAADPKKPTKMELLMKRKLLQAEKVLAGIAVHDFDRIEKHAKELVEICKEAEWKPIKTPLYQVYLDELRQNADDLLAAAKKKNVDAAALAYVNMTLTCVKCHKHVREKRMVRGD